MLNQHDRKTNRLAARSLLLCVLPSVFRNFSSSKGSEKPEKAYMTRAALVAFLSIQVLQGPSALGQAGDTHPVPKVPQLAPFGPPVHLQILTWKFADIHVTLMGPSTVKIDWMPLSGANQYVVNRNGAQVGPIYPADPGSTQPLSAMDNSAPANSHLTYTVTAYHLQTIIGLPGTPGAGQHTGEMPMSTSNPTAVDTPATVQSPAPLSGFVDLHTHPMANLGFGGRAFVWWRRYRFPSRNRSRLQ